MIGSKKIIIQARDLHLIRAIALLRAIDRGQAGQIGGFKSITRVNATLLRLVNAGLLNRFYMGVGPGTQKAIYIVTAKGAAVAGVSYRRFRRKNSELYSGDLFLAHQLLLNDIYLVLQKLQPAVHVQNWKTFERPLPQSSIIPDAYCELVFNNLIKPVFLEVDRNTESRKIWKTKTAAYLSFALAGLFENEFRQQQFRTLVITVNEQQLRRIQRVIADQTSKVFWLATLNDIKNAGFLSAIWQRPNSSERIAFF